MNIRDLDDSKIIKDLAGDVRRLQKRVAVLENQSTTLVTDRIDALRAALAHIWKEAERIFGQPLRRPQSLSKPRTGKVDPRAGVQAIASDMKREHARKDGERADQNG